MSSECAELEAAVETLERVVARLVPEDLDGDSSVLCLKLFARAGKYADAGQALVARRIEASDAHASRGHRTAAELLATIAGVPMERAATVVELGRRLTDQPLTDQALRRAELSLDQAGLISEAVAASPEAERDLLDVASRASVRTLRRKAREVRLAAEGDRDSVRNRQRAAQEFRHGHGRDGMIWGRFRLPPDVGVPLVNRVEEETDRLYRGADRAARHARTHAQIAADALARLVTGDAAPSAGRAEVVVHVSWSAVTRGRLEPGEICRLEDGDDVPLSVARELLDSGNAFVKGVLVDGTEVRKVKHFGRRISAALKTALRTEATLRDGHVRCSVPGCDRTQGLEWHHVQPHAHGGPTALSNLQPRCAHHHRAEHAQAHARAGRNGRPPP